MRVDEALALAHTLGLARLDAQLLLARRLAQPRSWLLAHDDAELPHDAEQGFRTDLAQRLHGVPLAYLVGERKFRGLRLAITPAVLVPRPDTETLVEWALACLQGRSSPRVLDLGTGSGAIAIAIACARPDARVTATDIDAAALEIARANASRHAAALDLRLGPWWQPLGGQRFDLVLSNPPYIAEGDPHLPALAHEPQHALLAGADGLAALRVLAAGAALHLEPGGQILVEHGAAQGEAVRALFAQQDLQPLGTRRDLGGHERCTGAARAEPRA